MKRNVMTRKVMAVALVLALCVCATLSVSTTAFAAAGNAVYSDAGAYNSAGTGAVTPDGVVADPTFNQTGIDVEARTTGGGDIVYNVKISWGDMKFTYNYGSTWDPATHSYSPAGAQNGGWDAGQVNGTNNEIKVTNDSNFPVTASFAYAHDGGVNPFGNAPANKFKVFGVFALNNAAAQGYAADSGTEPTTIVPPTLDLNTITASLQNGETYYYKGTDNEENEKSVYFTLMGTPARGLGMAAYQKVGTITVTINPATGVTKATKS